MVTPTRERGPCPRVFNKVTVLQRSMCHQMITVNKPFLLFQPVTTLVLCLMPGLWTVKR